MSFICMWFIYVLFFIFLYVVSLILLFFLKAMFWVLSLPWVGPLCFKIMLSEVPLFFSGIFYSFNFYVYFWSICEFDMRYGFGFTLFPNISVLTISVPITHYSFVFPLIELPPFQYTKFLYTHICLQTLTFFNYSSSLVCSDVW